MDIANIIILNLIFYTAVSAIEQCSNSETVGDKDAKKHSDYLDEVSGVMYLVKSEIYKFPCCGLIHAVKTHTLKNGDVRVFVWRPTGDSDTFIVAGDFRIEVTTAPRSGSILPTGSLQLQVQPGDFIGWYVPGESSIPYVDGDIDGHVAYMMTTETPKLGDTIDFSEATKETGRIYAIFATLIEDTNVPYFKGSPYEVQIKADSEIGSQVVNINLNDPQLQDAVVTVNDNPYFEISQEGRRVVLKSKPELGVYSLVLTSSSLCGLSDTTDVTITVTDKLVDPTTEVKEETKVTQAPSDTATDPNEDIETTQDTFPDESRENSTLDLYLPTPVESKSSLWKVLAGLSTSLILLSGSLLICRYGWVLYGGRFRSKTEVDVEKEPVPCTPDKVTDEDTGPEAADGGCIPETKQDDRSESTRNEGITEVETAKKVSEVNTAAVN